MTKYLTAVLLVLIFTAPAFAQQLVPQNDSKDPCRRFKMRVLAPPEVDRKMVSKPNDSIDRKMVINPCPSSDEQLASITPESKPKGQYNYVPFDPEPNQQRQKVVPLPPSPFLKFLPKQTQP